jgi:tetratricopeptide (TPR) repeat protein
MKKICLILLIFVLNAYASLSAGNFKKLQAIQQHIEKKEYKKAKEQLTVMLKSDNKTLRSYAHQNMAAIYLDKNQYDKAIKSYEHIIKLNTFNSRNLDQIRLILAQLHLSSSQYKRAVDYALPLLNKTHINKEKIYENLSLAYYYGERYKKSLIYTQKMIEFKNQQFKEYQALSKEEKKKRSIPKVAPWYEISYASHLELKEYPQALKILKHLIHNFESKEEYWMQMVLIHQNLKQPKKILSTLELAYKHQLINQERNIDYFVGFLLQEELYNKAAILIEKSLEQGKIKDNEKTFKLLVSAHINAKNNQQAIKYLRQSKYAKKERYQIMLANLYYNDGKYQQLIEGVNTQVFTKGSKRDGKKEILLALSYYEIGNENRAKHHLKMALNNKHEKRQAKSLLKQLDYKL